MKRYEKTRLVSCRCTNCGAPLDVEPDQKTAICPYCDTTFIVENTLDQKSRTVVKRDRLNAKGKTSVSNARSLSIMGIIGIVCICFLLMGIRNGYKSATSNHAYNTDGKSATTLLESDWCEQIPVKIEETEFTGETKTEIHDIFQYKVLKSWIKRDGSGAPSYVLSEASTFPFMVIGVQDPLDLNGSTYDQLDIETQNKILDRVIRNILKSGHMSKVRAYPAILKGRRMAIMKSDYEEEENNFHGHVRLFILPIQDRVLIVGIIYEASNEFLENEYNILNSIKLINE